MKQIGSENIHNHLQLYVVFMYHQIFGTNDRNINKKNYIFLM